MAKNDFLARQKARDRVLLDVGLHCGRQQILDMMTLAEAYGEELHDSFHKRYEFAPEFDYMKGRWK